MDQRRPFEPGGKLLPTCPFFIIPCLDFPVLYLHTITRELGANAPFTDGSTAKIEREQGRERKGLEGDSPQLLVNQERASWDWMGPFH